MWYFIQAVRVKSGGDTGLCGGWSELELEDTGAVRCGGYTGDCEMDGLCSVKP